MLRFRLKRIGLKNKPFYLIMLAITKSKRNSSKLFKIGFYNPFTKELKYNKILLYKYINTGSYLTNTLRHLILRTL